MADCGGRLSRILKTDHSEKWNMLTPLQRDNSGRGTSRMKRTRCRSVSEIQNVSECSRLVMFCPDWRRAGFPLSSIVMYGCDNDTFLRFVFFGEIEAENGEKPLEFVEKPDGAWAKGRRLGRERAVSPERKGRASRPISLSGRFRSVSLCVFSPKMCGFYAFFPLFGRLK